MKLFFNTHHASLVESISSFSITMNNKHPPGSTYDDSDDDYDEYVRFDPQRYPDGQHGAMYMRPPSLPPRNRTHDRKHQKKKFS